MHDPPVERLSALARAAPWIALAALLAYRVSSPVVDLDLFHQLALAREWLASGELPRVDRYAFTPTVTPFIHHEWGAGVIAYAVTSALGGTGILLLRWVLALALAVVALGTAWRAGAPRATTFVLAPLAIALVAPGYPPVRAHAYSFLFAAVTLYCCERDRSGTPRWLWLTVPVFVVWVNVHGGFVIGLALLVVYAAERALQRAPFAHVLGVAAVLVVAVGATPYGAEYYGHMARSLSQDRSLVREWAPVWTSAEFAFAKLAFAASLAFGAYALAYGRPPRRDGLLLVAFLAVVAARHQRMLPFYGAAWLVYCSAWLRGSALSSLAQRLAPRAPRATAVLSGGVVLLVATLLVRSDRFTLQVPNEPTTRWAASSLHYPVGAVNFLRAVGFEGNVLTPYDHGSYVLWKLHPRVKVSLDSRFEAAYPQPLVEELSRLYATGAGADEVLRRHRPDLVLVPRNSGLGGAGLAWPRVYHDGGFALYARPGLHLPAAAAPVPLSDPFP